MDLTDVMRFGAVGQGRRRRGEGQHTDHTGHGLPVVLALADHDLIAALNSHVVQSAVRVEVVAELRRAQELGASQAMLGCDRGLAYDMLGEQSKAEADYRAALSGPDSDSARRRQGT